MLLMTTTRRHHITNDNTAPPFLKECGRLIIGICRIDEQGWGRLGGARRRGQGEWGGGGETAGVARAGRRVLVPLPPAASFQKPVRQHATHMLPHLNFFIPPTTRGSRSWQWGSTIPTRCPGSSVYPLNEGFFLLQYQWQQQVGVQPTRCPVCSCSRLSSRRWGDSPPVASIMGNMYVSCLLFKISPPLVFCIN